MAVRPPMPRASRNAVRAAASKPYRFPSVPLFSTTKGRSPNSHCPAAVPQAKPWVQSRSKNGRSHRFSRGLLHFVLWLWAQRTFAPPSRAASISTASVQLFPCACTTS